MFKFGITVVPNGIVEQAFAGESSISDALSGRFEQSVTDGGWHVEVDSALIDCASSIPDHELWERGHAEGFSVTHN